MQPLAMFAAALMTPIGSHSGIVKRLSYDDDDLRDMLQDFCCLCNRLSLTSCCFFELYETDYGKRGGFSGAIKGMVRPVFLIVYGGFTKTSAVRGGAIGLHFRPQKV